jgi:hypothetical protein
MKNQESQCWNFVMSSLARSYGIPKVMKQEDFHFFALQWCDENNYKCDISLQNLKDLDKYFRDLYENDYFGNTL